MTHYDTLGVSRNATPEEIKSAYRKLAKQLHPDLGGDPERFKSINEAYEILSDPNKRAAYDNPPQQQWHGFRSGSNHFHFENLEDILGDDFINIFHGAAGFPRGARPKPRNSNLRTKISVTMESIVADQTHTILVNTGKEQKKVEIKIPAGIHHGAVINYRGMGQDIHPDQPAGDLLIEIYIDDNTNWQRVNDDLYIDIDVDCFKAVTGTTTELSTIRKKRIQVNIPPGTQQGTILRILNEGLPNVNNTKHVGHLYLKVNIKVPRTLSNEQLNLVNKIIDLGK